MTANTNAPETSDLADDVLPQGFRFAGVKAGIKASGKPDVSLIVTDRPAVAAGVYTTNQIVAAPVVLCRSRTPTSSFRGVVINSGNANACTGDQGDQDAARMTQIVADHVGCRADDVLVMSTGVIGHQLPMEKVAAGTVDAYGKLAAGAEAFSAAATAIMTTDAFRKVQWGNVTIGKNTYKIAAMAKGAGMISPNMATMLSVVITDAPLDENTCQFALKMAADESFNRVSVDGHTSTNDTLLLISSGEGESLSGDDLSTFQQTLNDVCIRLAKLLVADGEGCTHVLAIEVSGAASDTDATLIAKTIAASPLVKCAITGGDPNWGRIVSAAGYAGPTINPKQTSLKICGTLIYENGTPLPFDAKALSQAMKASSEVLIELAVGKTGASAKYWASDLTNDYVNFNSEYTT
ncbi:Arginine biosynthesis bifunctional protein ArgJ [Rubripirellula amarantea]|uniref:Arginine biosynthesis bifunctional protein ArgJ n=1 Tax=Rubripirellula amarantea TaxID=2527999 RepID=A0A5C5WVJ7_9BACT|nr:bifunctional glutamate N-acetyltransferase/amino-acid acetyltransferase ArgJ [Rubripirellula amarantea]TWT54737.1 Arginine biosynthesis bifunctional protein ArgJ [Rubripirellula amarantea]